MIVMNLGFIYKKIIIIKIWGISVMNKLVNCEMKPKKRKKHIRNDLQAPNR